MLIVIKYLSKPRAFADGWGRTNLCKNLELALADESIVQLKIDAGAGDLGISGISGQSEINVIVKVFGEKLSDDIIY